MPLYPVWGPSSSSDSSEKEEQEKEITAGVENVVVLPDEGKTLSKVTVKPTPSTGARVYADTSEISVDPPEGKLLSSVTVLPTPTEEKRAIPSGVDQVITPSSHKHLSKVTVEAAPLVEKTVDFSYDTKVYNASDEYVYDSNTGVPIRTATGFSKFTVNAPVTQVKYAAPNLDTTSVVEHDDGKVMTAVYIQPHEHSRTYPSSGYVTLDPGYSKDINLGKYHDIKTIKLKATMPKGYTVEWHGTAIWNNGSPTSSFAAQEITLPKTFQMYYDEFASAANGGEVYIDFVYRVHKDSTLSGSDFVVTVQPIDIMRIRLKDFMNYCQYGSYGGSRFCISCTGKTATSQYFRTITCSGERIVKFHSAYSASSTDPVNNWLIPTQIKMTTPTIVADPSAGYE